MKRGFFSVVLERIFHSRRSRRRQSALISEERIPCSERVPGFPRRFFNHGFHGWGERGERGLQRSEVRVQKSLVQWSCSPVVSLSHAPVVAVFALLTSIGRCAPPDALFLAGTQAYHAADYPRAARAFQESSALRPASGTLQNLGNAEWQRGHTGAAIVAWERALWLDPFNEAVRDDLRFARKTAQIEAPELAWYEVVSTWLPADWWVWIAGASLGLAVAMVTLPDVLRRPKAGWHQSIAAVGLMVFLLSVPAHLGIHTRSRIGFALQPETPLRLTPTVEAQVITRLAAGEPARCQRVSGNYVLIRASREGFRGWVERTQLGLICPELPSRTTRSSRNQNRTASPSSSS